MLQDRVAQSLAERAEDGYWAPSYEDYCFANVPETALSVLDDGFDARLPDDVFAGVETDVDNVVLFLLDGFGYEHWQRYHEEQTLLSALTDRGTVTPLTSIFPSETAAALTTVHTGRSPVEHGLLGWFQYLESAEQIIETLPFQTLEGESLADASPASDTRELFDGETVTVYEGAREAGIDSYAIQPDEFVESGYTRATTAGAERVGYDTVADLAVTIRRTLEDSSDPTYVYAYEPTIDAISHAEGTGTERYRTTLDAILKRLRHELVDRLDPDVAERTLLLVTADHGIVDTVPEENVETTEWDEWPALRETFRRDAAGEPRLPTGSPRNVHVHVQPDRFEEAREIVESNLVGRTFTREEALERGLFGPGTPSSLFERRCGDLIAVHRNRGLWWEEMTLIGMHGGLTREEMLVPFAATRLDALQR
ncbi:nucleotide pyrophosphatase [Natronococcus pandeyae]|uniref:Nucleotide pyrophosphatase n=1 Tax=Natronococcus pandeyae TaxID=2055836 RepID=A0A8J8TSD2_9EURY|nr:alkaline phosphatase family protein [Natronococcus pandeyae]TYL40493.1 nucleotide pyrophosphatase [Natronococcus pandeyae]